MAKITQYAQADSPHVHMFSGRMPAGKKQNHKFLKPFFQTLSFLSPRWPGNEVALSAASIKMPFSSIRFKWILLGPTLSVLRQGLCPHLGKNGYYKDVNDEGHKKGNGWKKKKEQVINYSGTLHGNLLYGDCGIKCISASSMGPMVFHGVTETKAARLMCHERAGEATREASKAARSRGMSSKQTICEIAAPPPPPSPH